jgi:hypothetical protein
MKRQFLRLAADGGELERSAWAVGWGERSDIQALRGHPFHLLTRRGDKCRGSLCIPPVAFLKIRRCRKWPRSGPAAVQTADLVVKAQITWQS